MNIVRRSPMFGSMDDRCQLAEGSQWPVYFRRQSVDITKFQTAGCDIQLMQNIMNMKRRLRCCKCQICIDHMAGRTLHMHDSAVFLDTFRLQV